MMTDEYLRHLTSQPYDDLAIPQRKPALRRRRGKLKAPVIPPKAERLAPLSCYLHSSFWVGAQAARREGRTITDNRIDATEAKLASAYEEAPIPERGDKVLIEAETKRHDEALRDLAALGRAATAGKDLSSLSAYHRWLAQSTAPVEPAAEEDET